VKDQYAAARRVLSALRAAPYRPRVGWVVRPTLEDVCYDVLQAGCLRHPEDLSRASAPWEILGDGLSEAVEDARDELSRDVERLAEALGVPR